MSDPRKSNTVVLVSRPKPASDLTRVEDYLEAVYELFWADKEGPTGLRLTLNCYATSFSR